MSEVGDTTPSASSLFEELLCAIAEDETERLDAGMSQEEWEEGADLEELQQ